METLRFASYDQEPNVDLTQVHQAMLGERNLLHPSLSSVRQSYEEGKAIVLARENSAVGYVRFSPLIDDNLRRNLQLRTDFPLIWEFGSAILLNNPEYRGRGYYPELKNELLRRYQSEIQNNKLLVLATTKTFGIIKALPKTKEGVGIDFHVGHHLEFPMIAPFTCVCEGSFGQGLHLCARCPVRIPTEIVPTVANLQALIKPDGGTIPCVMTVSSRSLASEMNQELKDAFGSQQTLIAKLQSLGYF